MENDGEFFENLLKDYVDVKVPSNQDDHSLEKSIKILKQDLNNPDILDYCNVNDISPTTLFMSSTILTLDKFTYSTNSLLTNIFNGKNYDSLKDLSKELPIVVDRKNRDQSIKTLLDNVDNCLNNALDHCLAPIEKIFSQKDITTTIAYGYFENFSQETLEKTVFKDIDGKDRDLQIYFIRNDNDFSAYLSYNSQLYTSDYMNVFINSVKTIIDKIINVDGEKSSIKDISLTDELIEKDTSFKIPNLVELFEKQVSLNHSKTALIVDDEEISYEELNKNANRIANSLLGKIDSKSRIVILLPRGKELMYSIWGVLKAGCAFVLLDESYPKDRLDYIIDDCESSAIITNQDFNNAITPEELLNNENAENPNVSISADDLAYILYTSGTTGMPKGVMISHKNNANITMPAEDNVFNQIYTENVDRLLSLTSVSHAPALIDYVTALSSGLTIVYANGDETKNINALMDLIENYRPEIIGSITPSRLSQYLEIPSFVNAFKHLKKVVLLGEKFPPSLYTKIKSKHSSIMIYNFYGSSETTGIGIKEIVSENITVGHPIHYAEGYIMDVDEKALPANVKGQLYVSGPSIALGYTDKEHDTAFINIGDKRFFKTGDLGSFLDNGEIKLYGRADNQIKIRGQRLEPDEITTLINKFPNISNSIIRVHEINGLQNLIAYYVSDAEINNEELISYLERKLPVYMIPSQFIEIPEIPTNVNGKLDASRLPEPSVNDIEYVAPTNEKEELVVEAFEELFNKKIGINDDFILLGGTSLSLMYIISYLSGYNITGADILQLRTPKKIAAHLQEINIDLDEYGFDDAVQLSASQLNVYLDEIVNDMGTGYNNSFEVEFKENYSVKDIKNALIKLAEVHPILKARIIKSEGKWPHCIFDGEIEIEEGTSSDVKSFVRPFEIDKYLSRFLIVENGDSRSLCMDIHHLIFDGTSINILLNTLFSILNNEPVEFVDKGTLRQISFEENIDSQYMHDAQEFYETMLADIDEVYELLPCVDGDDGFEHISTFDMDDNYLSSFLQKNEITHTQFFASVFSYTLSRFTGSPKVLFNLIVDGRGHIDLSKSVGMFAKTLPILMDCKNQDVSSFLKYSSNLITSSMKYDLYPLNVLTHEYDLNADIIFQYSHDIFKNEVCELKHDVQRDLTFFIYTADENKLGIKVVYSDKFSKEFIERFVDCYILILNEIMDANELADINYISESDLLLLDSYNETEHPLMYDDIMDAFNDNLSKRPNNNLVSMGSDSYTYSQGAFIADKIAKQLTDSGVKSQDCVAFLVERSELYMFSVLSILSIGAIYVPLDDTHPDERIKYILEDTAAKTIIVSDETMERAKTLSEGSVLLNISDILKGDIGSVSSLPINYGSLSCILYTSGTTGLPKGVKVTRKSSLNVPSYYADRYHLTDEDIYGLYSSIGFDAASLAILSTIYAGACLSIIPGDIRLDMNGLNEYFIKNGITHTFITTQVGKLFVKTIDKTSLNVLVVGGEKLGEFESPENYEFIDIYGPTEAFVFVASTINSEKIDSSSVGNLIYNTKAYILDNEGRKVPVGAVGELYLAGYQIAEGYLNRPENNSFVDNPFEDGEYGKSYRTGDMVRLMPDGTIAVVGRLDSQVKIRGNRVELSEVESAIREIDYIQDVTVKTIKNGDNYELVAYVVSTCLEGTALKDDIQNYVGEIKPDYMIPSYVIKLDKIPLNVNGKVDKRKLPEITPESKEYEAPEDYLEIVIANVFSEVLNIEKISRNDKFSALGGDSIDVISLISKLRELNIHITVKDVMDEQTVKKIAKKAEYKISAANISQETFEGFVNPTPTTQYFWNLNLKNPSFFHVPCLLETSKKIDKDILAKSMMDVVNYHDILRAIVKDEKLFVRPQNDEEIFTMEYCDLSKISDETERINREIDIFNGPLIKLAIFEDEKVDYLYICFHHLLVDSNSLRIIINDLNLAYTQRSHNMETELYSKTSSYQDYALAVGEYKNDVLEEKSYWENTLSSLKELNHTEINSDAIKRDSFSFRLPHQISSILFTNAPKYYDCSINGLFLSMIVKSWKETMGENEVSVRLNQDERMNFDNNILIERTVGWLDSFYPVILKCDGQNNKEIIANTEKILSEIPNNGFDYPILNGIETSDIPLFHFSYTNEFNLVGGGKMFNPKHYNDLARFTAPENNFMCDITIYGYTINNETYFKIDYNGERFTRKTMEKFGYALLKNINGIITFTQEDYSRDAHIFSDLPDKKKLFFIHSANFGSEYFYYMAQKLKDKYSFIVLEPYNRNHRENQLSSIEEFAEKYIEIIKSIQPEGPYYIGGYCFGGIIAHEIAVQLKKQNERVDKLIIFESYYIDDNELKDLSIEEQKLYACDFLKDGILNPKHETIEDMISYSLSSVNIMYSYKPSYYDGNVIYFKGTVQDNDFDTEFSRLYDFYYSKKAGGYENFYDNEKLKIESVPVGHDYLLNVESLRIIIPKLIKFIDEVVK